MSVRTKILLVLSTIVFAMGFLAYAIFGRIIYPGFLEVEAAQGREDMARCIGALRREASYLGSLCRDWAFSDETYRFMQNRDRAYIAANLGDRTFRDNKLSLVYLCDPTGDVMWSESRDVASGRKILVPDIPITGLPANHPLKPPGIETGAMTIVEGLYITRRGPFLVSSRPIIGNHKDAPTKGFMIVGKLLDENLLSSLRDQTRVPLRFWVLDRDFIPESDAVMRDQVTEGIQFPVRTKGQETLFVYATYPDVTGRPSLLLRADIDRSIATSGAELVRVAWISVLVAGLLIMLILLALLQEIVVVPVTSLTRHVARLGRREDLSARLTVDRRDEFGVLSREFNRMVEQIDLARKRMMEEMYSSGMAEMAADMLHNVRNALTPVVDRLDRILEGLRDTPLEQLQRAQKELQTGGVDEERKKELERFLKLANDTVIAKHGELLTAINALGHDMNRVEELLTAQGEISRSGTTYENVQLAELVTQAMTFFDDETYDDVYVDIDDSVHDMQPFGAQRIPLVRVIARLIRNAANSIRKGGVENGRISVTATLDHMTQGEMVHLQIADNGQGIVAADLKRIFRRGGDSADEETNVFGLHWCANTIRAMNGMVSAESEGFGKGTCFHVLIPRVE